VNTEPKVRVDIAQAKRRAAEHLQRAHQEIPAYYVFRDARADRLADYCKHMGVSPTARLLAMVALWLSRFPDLNAHWNSELHPIEKVNLGLALNHTVGKEEALVVVTFTDCIDWGSTRFQRELDDLRNRSRANAFRPTDFAPASFTVSTLGAYGVGAFTSIINRPQVGILSVAAFREVIAPSASNGVVAATVLPLTIGADHRAVAGAYVARALADLCSHIEENDASD
jgi:pyruvate dehydrogenase E2 component (dihydrolipoamide acetyltransferase)